MRYVSFLIGAILVVVINAGAQVNVVNPPANETFPQVALMASSGGSFNFTGLPATTVGIAGVSLPAASPTAEPPQYVQSVYENYAWQAYIGYEYLRLYQAPSFTKNTNGFTYSMVYYINNWFGLDGELDATHLSELGTDGWFLMGGGGPRFRWSAPRGLELWAHALGGYSHLTPQTALGSEHAPAFEAGGGVDINSHHRRLAYRVEADMMGTHYYNTFQYSPKVTAGIVIKF
jgi:hypothetical protein